MSDKKQDAIDAEEDKVLSANEAAKYLGVSRATLYNFMREGRLSRIDEQTAHDQPRLRFRQSEIERFKAEQIARRAQRGR